MPLDLSLKINKNNAEGTLPHLKRFLVSDEDAQHSLSYRKAKKRPIVVSDTDAENLQESKNPRLDCNDAKSRLFSIDKQFYVTEHPQQGFRLFEAVNNSTTATETYNNNYDSQVNVRDVITKEIISRDPLTWIKENLDDCIEILFVENFFFSSCTSNSHIVNFCNLHKTLDQEISLLYNCLKKKQNMPKDLNTTLRFDLEKCKYDDKKHKLLIDYLFCVKFCTQKTTSMLINYLLDDGPTRVGYSDQGKQILNPTKSEQFQTEKIEATKLTRALENDCVYSQPLQEGLKISLELYKQHTSKILSNQSYSAAFKKDILCANTSNLLSGVEFDNYKAYVDIMISQMYDDAILREIFAAVNGTLEFDSFLARPEHHFLLLLRDCYFPAADQIFRFDIAHDVLKSFHAFTKECKDNEQYHTHNMLDIHRYTCLIEVYRLKLWFKNRLIYTFPAFNVNQA